MARPSKATAGRGSVGNDPDVLSVLGVTLLMISVALISMTPVVHDWASPSRSGEQHFEWQRWMFALMFLALLQFVGVIYFAFFPEAIVCRLAAALSLALGVFYAGLLAYFSFVARDSAPLLWLELHEAQGPRNAARWCQIMLCLFLIQAYIQFRLFERRRA